MDWLGYRQPADFLVARRFGVILGTLVPLALGALALGTVLHYAVILANVENLGTKDLSEAIRNTGLAAAAMIGVPFLIWRSVVAQKQVNVAEQGLITDRINTAVQGLGAEKITKRHASDENGKSVPQETTVPNIEVRIGAIYALERISQDSDRDHVQIMEILCAYIRENAPASGARTPDQDEIAPLTPLPDNVPPDDRRAHAAAPTERAKKLGEWARNLRQPRSDIRVALEVIGRRAKDRIALERPGTPDTPPYHLDLRDTNLQRADLTGLDFEHALLTGAHLEGANLMEAHLGEANLLGAHLEGAKLWDAHLEGANLFAAHLEGADLDGAHLEGANLIEAHLEGANLEGAHLEGAKLCGAHLEGTHLWGAHLEGADLGRAHLKGAVLGGAHLEGADLTRAQVDEDTCFTAAILRGAVVKGFDFTLIAMQQDQIDSTFGDGTTTIANPCRPSHWPDADLGRAAFIDEYDRWRANPASYVPPQDRA